MLKSKPSLRPAAMRSSSFCPSGPMPGLTSAIWPSRGIDRLIFGERPPAAAEAHPHRHPAGFIVGVHQQRAHAIGEIAAARSSARRCLRGRAAPAAAAHRWRADQRNSIAAAASRAAAARPLTGVASAAQQLRLARFARGQALSITARINLPANSSAACGRAHVRGQARSPISRNTPRKVSGAATASRMSTALTISSASPLTRLDARLFDHIDERISNCASRPVDLRLARRDGERIGDHAAHFVPTRFANRRQRREGDDRCRPPNG